MASKYWLKLYHEMLDDPKVASLNDSAYRRFIECLLLAGEVNESGLLPPIRDMAWRLRTGETSLADDMTHLALNGLVELVQHNGANRWLVSKFEERQARSKNAERQARFRRRRKEAKEEEEEKEIKITDTDTYIYGNVTSNVTSNAYDAHEENATPQEVLDVITSICNVVKGQSALMPSDDLERIAYSIVNEGDENRIPGFTQWWKANGFYAGKPALKSFIAEWDNYLDGVDMTATTNGDDAVSMAQRVEAKYNVVDN